MIRSPLRYPGGKSKALVKNILPRIPGDYGVFREPFVGGGSVFIAAKQRINPGALYEINDLNEDLYCFWKNARDDNAGLVEAVSKIRREIKDGRALFDYYVKEKREYSEFDRAVRYFVLNRITFSGTVDSGGYSQQAFHRRFTDSSIQRLENLRSVLKDVEITLGDYEAQIARGGDGVFIFLDPPYFSAVKSRLYGNNGDLHRGFDHERFARVMKECRHQWLITLDDSPEIRELFDFAFILEWKLQYGMNNYKREKAGIGKELFIANYDLSAHQSRYCPDLVLHH